MSLIVKDGHKFIVRKNREDGYWYVWWPNHTQPFAKTPSFDFVTGTVLPNAIWQFGNHKLPFTKMNKKEFEMGI